MLLHSTTEAQLASMLASQPQALVIVGPSGSGKLSLAKRMAETMLQATNIEQHPYVLHLGAEQSTTVGIEAVRSLEQFLALKVPSEQAVNRAVLIEGAHKLTIEAQNALLKTLEEPPQGTTIILTATSTQTLLPTIRSRVQTLTVHLPEREHVESYFGASFAQDQIAKTYRISGGLPGLMTAMMQDASHPLLAATEMARTILQQDRYQRLLLVDQLSKDKQLASDTLFILQQMAHVSLQTATGSAAKRWQRVLAASYAAEEAMAASTNPKLVMTNVMLQL